MDKTITIQLTEEKAERVVKYEKHYLFIDKLIDSMEQNNIWEGSLTLHFNRGQVPTFDLVERIIHVKVPL